MPGLLKILTDPGNFRFYSGKGSSSAPTEFGQRDIEFSNDRPDGAYSGQPYIKTSIPDVIPPNTPDFIIRGGEVGAPLIAATDTSRIYKMFTDTRSTNGLFFTGKQNLLARQNPKQVGTNRVYDPLNTLAQIPLNVIGQHIAKDASDPISAATYVNNDENRYRTLVKNLDQEGINRLAGLYDRLAPKTDSDGNDKIKNVSLKSEFGIPLPNRFNRNPNVLLSYRGGAESDFGIDKTRINRYSFTDSYATQIKNLDQNRRLLGLQEVLNIKNFKGNTLSLSQINNLASISSNLPPGSIISNGSSYVTSTLGISDPDNYPNTQDITVTQRITSFTRGYRENPKAGNTTDPTALSLDEYGFNNIDSSNQDRNNMYAKGANMKGISFKYSTPGDIYPTFTRTPTYVDPDYVTFSIGILNYDIDVNTNIEYEDSEGEIYKTDNTTSGYFYKWLNFKALIEPFSDNYSATWDTFKYVGRGEDFATYQGFTRTMSMPFKVAAFSNQDLIGNYYKLGQLASALTPNYNRTGGYMRGPLVRITIGDYIKNQWAYITSLGYKPLEGSPWETNKAANNSPFNPSEYKWKGEMPHHIDVTDFSFTPIHNFVPKTFDGRFIHKNDIEIARKQIFNYSDGTQATYVNEDNTVINYDNILSSLTTTTEPR